MAYGKVTEDTVYTCTGHPLRSDIANILDWSLNKDFTTAYKRILHNACPPGLFAQEALRYSHQSIQYMFRVKYKLFFNPIKCEPLKFLYTRA